MRHPLTILRDEEAELSRKGLQTFGIVTVYPLCLGCHLCTCKHTVECAFGSNGDDIESHLAYIMYKGTMCSPVVVCCNSKGEVKECPCCCKDYASLIFGEEENQNG